MPRQPILASWTSLFLGCLLLMPAAAQPPCCQPPPKPGLVLLDDMWVPESVITGDGTINGTLWTNGNVYYVFESSISSTRRELFRRALHELEAVSHLSFVEVSSNLPSNYIRVLPSTDSGVSSSEIGMTGGEQELRIWSSHWTEKHIIMHEMMHALAFKHEQTRPDRDAFVTIIWPLIEAGREHNFQLSGGASTYGSYDFLSIMHYRSTAFTISPGVPTIVCKPGFDQFQDQIGNRSFLSTGDCNTLQAVYGQPVPPTVTSITPTSAYAGSGAVNLTVTGSWYYEGPITNIDEAGSRVTINGVAVTSNFVDHHTLTCTIPATMLQSPGNLTIRVQNHSEAGGTSTSAANFIVQCATVSADRGHSVTGLGDVNDDGYDDYAVGWPGEFTQTGRVVVHSGLTSAVLWQSTGPGTNSGHGYALANIGDVNNDGADDLLIGSPYYNSLRGRFEIRSGASGTQLALVNGGTTGYYFGNAVAAAGDVDGDGDLDFLVGAPGANSNTGRVELWSANGGLMRSHVGESTNDAFGIAIAGGYDMTGDGRPDYIVGAPFAEGGGALRGKVYGISGVNGNSIFTRTGTGDYDKFGTSVVVLPRVGAYVGTADFAVGAPESGANGTGASTGRGYVTWYRGGGSFLIPSPNYQVLGTVQGITIGDCYGYSLASAGDVDDDGRTDLIVGAIQYAEGASGVVGDGYAEIFSPSTSTRLYRHNGPTPLNPNSGGRRGYSVSLIGDRDADGRFDYVVGAPDTDVPCLGAGSVDVFAAAVPPAIRRVLITEVSCSEPDAVELTNYGTASINLNGWTIVWRDGGALWTSTTLDITLAPGEIAVITEPGSVPAETPPGIQVVTRLPAISTSTSDFAVGLVTGTGHVVDEVRVARPSTGIFSDNGVGGKFRGYAANEQTAISGFLYFPVHVERSNGLDSNSGSDWYTSPTRSLGLENRAAGDRGFDPIATSKIRINEIDTDPDYIELKSGISTEDVTNWYLLASSLQGNLQTVIRPDWDQVVSFNIYPPQFYVVLGDQATPPSELPITGGYMNVGSPGFPFITSEYDLTLYDNYGRVVDHVRATQQDSAVVHNHPRAPTATFDFRGAAFVETTADSSIGRNHVGWDTNNGRDWRAQTTRTMGFVNVGPPWWPSCCEPGGEGVDFRLNATRGGGGLTFIINAGESYAGRPWSFTFSIGHLNGTGPIEGLGPDAVNNWLFLVTTPPWFGYLDNRGSVRIDVPAGALPPGIDTDNVIFIHAPNGAVEILSPIYEYDS